MSTSSSFSYPPLVNAEEDFRLLTIKPGSQTDQIRCTLTNLARASAPKYDALSYTWGTEDPSTSILLNGFDFRVRPNLESVMRHLRRADTDVVLWIDAVCMDQNNTQERNSQVQWMREIYVHAEKVVMWLGDEDEYSQQAVALLRKVSALGRYDRTLSSPSVGDTQQWNAINELFKREYFARIWIIQEISLAKRIDVRIGKHTMSWDTFVQALQWCNEDLEYAKRSLMAPDSNFVRACQLRNAWARRRFHGRSDGLDYLLGSFATWRATKPLDKVYGLMGLSEEHNAPELRIDYELSVPQVFSRVVRFLINRDGRLDILGQCDNPPERHDLPSWVPDWSTNAVYRQQLSERYREPGSAQVQVQVHPVHGPLILVPTSLALPSSGYGTWQQEPLIPEEMNFCATLDTRAQAFFPTESCHPPFYCQPEGTNPKPETTMRLRGAPMDTIDTVSKPLFRLREDVDDPVFMLAWEEFALLSPEKEHAVQDTRRGTFAERLETYWRTLITNRISRDRGNIRATAACGELFDRWRARMIEKADPVDRYVPVNATTVDLSNKTSAAQLMYNVLSTKSLSQLRDNPDINALDDQYRNITISSSNLVPETSPIYAEYQTWKNGLCSDLKEPCAPKRAGSSSLSFDKQTPVPRMLPEELTVDSFESSIRHWCFARKLATTVKGRLALVPEHTRPGDQVCLLFGGSVPYVVREKQHRMVTDGRMFHDSRGEYGPPGMLYPIGQPLHQFVGEAYVHGIMDGEGMQDVKQTTKEEELGQEYWFE